MNTAPETIPVTVREYYQLRYLPHLPLRMRHALCCADFCGQAQAEVFVSDLIAFYSSPIWYATA